MDLHRTLGHPHEASTRATARPSGIALTGEWTPCEECSKKKAHAYSVPKITNNKATEKLERVFIDLTGPMKTVSVGGRRYAMIFLDDVTDMSWIRILNMNGDTTTALENFISQRSRLSPV